MPPGSVKFTWQHYILAGSIPFAVEALCDQLAVFCSGRAGSRMPSVRGSLLVSELGGLWPLPVGGLNIADLPVKRLTMVQQVPLLRICPAQAAQPAGHFDPALRQTLWPLL